MQIRSDHLPTILAKRQMGDGVLGGMCFGRGGLVSLCGCASQALAKMAKGHPI
jgi:hypothetical protein